MPVSSSERVTCPPQCGLRHICYAQFAHCGLHWRDVAEHGKPWAEFVDAISRLPPASLWRHNEAGDLPGEGDSIDAAALKELVAANKGKAGYTYTHKPVLGHSPVAVRNRALIKQANLDGFTINLSADNLRHADRLAELDIGPVVVTLPHDALEDTVTPQGRQIMICPHSIDPSVQCLSCWLCRTTARPIIGLPAHGTRKRQYRS